MKNHDLQGIEIDAAFEQVFTYIEDASKLPEWTNAFASVSGERAVMRTPQGEVEIGLTVNSQKKLGTLDWEMTFPDGSVGHAYTRLIALTPDRCAYSFILPNPPAPLEQLEGALEEQRTTLTRELATLKERLER